MERVFPPHPPAPSPAGSEGEIDPITRLEQLNAIERQTEDFFGAIAGPGPRISIEWKLSAGSIERGQETVLSLLVRNAINPAELARPNLKERDEFKELFETVENLPDTPGDGKTVEFRYRLKPRKEGTITIPVPRYRFYVPPLPEGRRFQTISVEPPVLTVLTKTVVAVPQVQVPLEAPERYWQVPTLQDDRVTEPSRWHWVGLIILTVVVPTIWIAIWRKWNPTATELARIRRILAVRTALERLNTEDAAIVSRAFREYLNARLHVPPEAQTPGEIRRSMANQPEAEAAERILQLCDERRFSPKSGNANVAELAKNWILHWEGGQKP